MLAKSDWPQNTHAQSKEAPGHPLMLLSRHGEGARFPARNAAAQNSSSSRQGGRDGL